MYNKGMYVEVNVVGYGGNDNRRFSYLADSSSGLVVGNIVMVKFGRKSSLGIIRALNTPAPKPPIKVQPIADILPIDPLPEHLLKLADWIIDYYVAPSSTVWQMLIPRNSTTRPRKAFKKIEYNTQPIVQLSSPQKSTFNDITQSTQASLLEGAMGSGKTEIYFHLISRQLASGRSSIMLMPEIFLTKQMIERARKHFGSKLIITHSSMTPAERRSFWVDCSARSKESGLVVLGLILRRRAAAAPAVAPAAASAAATTAYAGMPPPAQPAFNGAAMATGGIIGSGLSPAQAAAPAQRGFGSQYAPQAPAHYPPAAAPAAGGMGAMGGAVMGGVAGLAAGYALSKAMEGGANHANPAASNNAANPSNDSAGYVPFDNHSSPDMGAFDAGAGGDSWDVGQAPMDDEW